MDENTGECVEPKSATALYPRLQYIKDTQKSEIIVDKNCLSQMDEHATLSYHPCFTEDTNFKPLLGINREETHNQSNIGLCGNSLSESLDKCTFKNFNETTNVLEGKVNRCKEKYLQGKYINIEIDDGENKNQQVSSDFDVLSSNLPTCFPDERKLKREMPLVNECSSTYDDVIQDEEHEDTSINTQFLCKQNDRQMKFTDLKYHSKYFLQIPQIKHKRYIKNSCGISQRELRGTSNQEFNTGCNNESELDKYSSCQNEINLSLKNQPIIMRGNSRLSSNIPVRQCKLQIPETKTRKCSSLLGIEILTNDNIIMTSDRLNGEELTSCKENIRGVEETISDDNFHFSNQKKTQRGNTDSENVHCLKEVDRREMDQMDITLHSSSDIKLNVSKTHEMCSSRISADINKTRPREVTSNGTAEEIYFEKKSESEDNNDCMKTSLEPMFFEATVQGNSGELFAVKSSKHFESSSFQRENEQGSEEVENGYMKGDGSKHGFPQTWQMMIYGICPECIENATAHNSVVSRKVNCKKINVKDIKSIKYYESKTFKNRPKGIERKRSNLEYKEPNHVAKRVTFLNEFDVFSYNPEETVFHNFYSNGLNTQDDNDNYFDNNKFNILKPHEEEKSVNEMGREDKKAIENTEEYK